VTRTLANALGGAMTAMAVVAFVTLGFAGAQTDDTAGGVAPDPLPAAAATTSATAATAPRVLPALAMQDAAPDPTPARVAPAEVRRGAVTGFPIPRFVSLGASEANARRGPSRSHRIDWVFTRRDMPVRIVAEHGHWRRVVDRDGVGGWMHYSLLSGIRTAIVDGEMLALHSRPDAGSPVRARAEPGVIGRLRECRPAWCLMEVGGYRGWVDPRGLWGVEPGEVFD
jgi:SH3-like domain-containing protein